MATINVKMIQTRFGVQFASTRKAIDTHLDTVRKYFNVIGEKKTSGSGMSTTCAQIVSFLAETRIAASEVNKFHERIKEWCEECMFFKERDAATGNTRKELSAHLTSIQDYLTHFQRLLSNKSAEKAAESAIKHRKDVVLRIDNAKKSNKKFETVVVAYIKSDDFAALVVAPDSLVSFKPSELIGTKQQKREFIERIDKATAEELTKSRIEDKKFLVSDASGIAGRNDDALLDDDNDDDDDEAEKSSESSVDEDVNINENEEESESAEQGEGSDATGTGEESAEFSSGALAFEDQLAANNAKILAEVAATAKVTNGRALRQRRYTRIDLDKFGHLLDKNQVDDNRRAKPKNGAKKRARTDEEEDSAMTESSEAVEYANDELEAAEEEIRNTRSDDAQRAAQQAAERAAFYE
jgi:hypothetical protein